jgi:hypothetical protein
MAWRKKILFLKTMRWAFRRTSAPQKHPHGVGKQMLHVPAPDKPVITNKARRDLSRRLRRGTPKSKASSLVYEKCDTAWRTIKS